MNHQEASSQLVAYKIKFKTFSNDESFNFLLGDYFK